MAGQIGATRYVLRNEVEGKSPTLNSIVPGVAEVLIELWCRSNCPGSGTLGVIKIDLRNVDLKTRSIQAEVVG